MINRAQINRQHINWTAMPVIWIRNSFAERLTGTAGIGAIYFIEQRYDEQLAGRTMSAAGVSVKAAFSEIASGSAIVAAGVNVAQQFSEVMQGDTYMGANIYASQKYSEDMKASAVFSATIYVYNDLHEAMQARAHFGADIYISRDFYEVLNGFASSQNIEEVILNIRDPIPPGGVLVIDAEEYNVLLNNIEIIAQHSGGWIWVNRGTQTITLSGTGGDSFAMEVLYNALYL